MRAGEMRERIKIYTVPDPDGPTVDLDAEGDLYDEIWTKREDKVTEERWGVLAQNAIRKKQFIIRWRDDLNESMKIKFKSGTFDILAIADLDNTNQWTIMLAEEVVNSGY